MGFFFPIFFFEAQGLRLRKIRGPLRNNGFFVQSSFLQTAYYLLVVTRHPEKQCKSYLRVEITPASCPRAPLRGKVFFLASYHSLDAALIDHSDWPLSCSARNLDISKSVLCKTWSWFSPQCSWFSCPTILPKENFPLHDCLKMAKPLLVRADHPYHEKVELGNFEPIVLQKEIFQISDWNKNGRELWVSQLNFLECILWSNFLFTYRITLAPLLLY